MKTFNHLIPDDRKLDIEIAKKFYGCDVVGLPAYREPECGSVTECIDPDEHDFAPFRDKWDYCSTRSWNEADNDSGAGGVYPFMRIVSDEDPNHHWHEALRPFSSNLNNAWNVVDKLRAMGGKRWDYFYDIFKDRAGDILASDKPAQVICEMALQALEA